jgi:hypothetical protein
MRVKVNKTEIENLTKRLDENSAELLKEIESCLKDTENIKAAYQSAESPYVTDTVEGYLKYLKIIPYTYNELNNIIKKANQIYDEQDSEFLKEIQRENAEDENEHLHRY